MSRKARKKKETESLERETRKSEKRKFVCSDPVDLRAQEILKELSEFSKYEFADLANDAMNVIRDLLSIRRTNRDNMSESC